MGRRKGDERFLVQCKRVTSGAFSIGPQAWVFLLPHECNSPSLARLPPRIVHFGYVNLRVQCFG
jgi:hypothetical protein